MLVNTEERKCLCSVYPGGVHSVNSQANQGNENEINRTINLILKVIDERSLSPHLRETISELRPEIKPATLWWLVRYSNHQATETLMTSSDVSSTYMLPKRQPQFVDNDIKSIYICKYCRYLRWSMKARRTNTWTVPLNLGSSMVRPSIWSLFGDKNTLFNVKKL